MFGCSDVPGAVGNELNSQTSMVCLHQGCPSIPKGNKCHGSFCQAAGADWGSNIWQLEVMPGEPLCCPPHEGKSPWGIPGPTAGGGGGVGDLGWVEGRVGGPRGDVGGGGALWVSVTAWCTWLRFGCAHSAAEALSRVEIWGFRVNVQDAAPDTDKRWQVPDSSRQGRKSTPNTPGAM